MGRISSPASSSQRFSQCSTAEPSETSSENSTCCSGDKCTPAHPSSHSPDNQNQPGKKF